MNGDNGYAPLALQRSREPLLDCAKSQGIAALSIIHTHHFAVLWMEVSALAELGLCAFAFTAYMPCVAPAGGSKPFYGTNPMAFGLDPAGQPSTDPSAILKGAQLAFGGHKGAALALMIELLVGPLIGERSSFEAAEADNGDGGPPRGGELLLAIDPSRFGDPERWEAHAEALFARLLEQPGTRLPADRRYRSREQPRLHGIEISGTLFNGIHKLAGIDPA